MNGLALGLSSLIVLSLLLLLIPLVKYGTSRTPVILTVIFLPLFSLSLYALIGNPLITARHEAKDINSQEMQGLITKLSKRLASEPNDIEGWRLLAHSYLTQQNLDQAQHAFEQVHQLDPTDIGATLSLIDILVTQHQGQMTKEIDLLIQGVLQQEPTNTLALWFAYLSAKQRNDLIKLKELEEKININLPTNDPISHQIQQQLKHNK